MHSEKGDHTTPDTSETAIGDAELFARAMSGVRPLKGTPRIAPEPPRRHRPHRRYMHHAHRVAPADEMPVPNETDVPFGTLERETTLYWERTPLRPQDRKKLRQGHFSTPWRLDLHGMSAEEAQRTLAQFLHQAWQLGARHALIIHGKGYNAPHGAPVLKNLAASTIVRLPFVLAISSAQPKDGGAGAVYVFMKKQK